jgi:hypothetical protein
MALLNFDTLYQHRAPALFAGGLGHALSEGLCMGGRPTVAMAVEAHLPNCHGRSVSRFAWK